MLGYGKRKPLISRKWQNILLAILAAATLAAVIYGFFIAPSVADFGFKIGEFNID